MTTSTILQNAHSNEEAAGIITAGTSFNTSEELAGQYAFDAAKSADYGFDDDTIEAHLDFIKDDGAIFEYSGALNVAKSLAKEYLLAQVFGRMNGDGNVELLMVEDGSAVTRLDADLYPVDSDVSTRYEHPNGIVLSVDDAKRIGIAIENVKEQSVLEKEVFLMNPYTGSVDTADNWASEGFTSDNAELIEVVKDANGDWVTDDQIEQPLKNVEQSRVPPDGIKEVSEGRHIGNVVDVAGGYVIQDAGRGQMKAHALDKFDKEPQIGKMLDVTHRDGKAYVADSQGQAKDRGR